MKFSKEWFMAALARAIRTAAQVALGMFTVGMALHEVNWLHVLSVAAVAAIYSFLTSAVGKLPELEKPELTPDGSLTIDVSDPDVYGVFMNFANKSVEDIMNRDKVVLEVKTGVLPEDAPEV